MKVQILSTEKIEVTEFNMEANVIELDSIPTIEEQKELLGDESIVLMF